MQEAVSAVLHERAHVDDGINRTFAVSVAAHIAIVAAIWLAPSGWRSRPAAEQPSMTISLGTTEGPNTGGMTSIADRAVQEVARPNAPKVADTPPAPKPPEMAEPLRTAKPTPPRAVAKPADTAKPQPPTVGAELKTGSARVKTGGAAIQFGGLAQGGGTAGAGVQLDVKNFCCPEYLAQMVQKIRQNWNPNQGAVGQPIVKFTIRRDGMLTNVELEKSSGQELLDLAARRAVHNTMQLAPLPREFTESSLTVHLTFDFQR